MASQQVGRPLSKVRGTRSVSDVSIFWNPGIYITRVLGVRARVGIPNLRFKYFLSPEPNFMQYFKIVLCIKFVIVEFFNYYYMSS